MAVPTSTFFAGSVSGGCSTGPRPKHTSAIECATSSQTISTTTDVTFSRMPAANTNAEGSRRGEVIVAIYVRVNVPVLLHAPHLAHSWWTTFCTRDEAGKFVDSRLANVTHFLEKALCLAVSIRSARGWDSG